MYRLKKLNVELTRLKMLTKNNNWISEIHSFFRAALPAALFLLLDHLVLTRIFKSINIYDGNIKLAEGKDYEVKYDNNIKTGKATITVKGKENYTGTITRDFYIVPKKAYIRRVLFSSNFKKATIEWDRDKQASGYVIYMATKKELLFFM